MAFGLGMLAGVVLWPDGADTIDARQQSAETSKVSAAKSQRAAREPTALARTTRPEPSSPRVGPAPQYGAAPTWAATAWDEGARFGRSGEGPARAPHAGRQAAHPNSPYYNAPAYRDAWGATGYRFRPLDTAAHSGANRRYTGNYPVSRQPWEGTAGRRWNDSPADGRPQPKRRGAPQPENRRFPLEMPSGHLYSAR